jgi:regulator of protease activity HflC (stomatin/prohibitin superfamily)
MRSTQLMRQFAMFDSAPAGRVMRRGRRVTVNEWEQGLLFHHGRLVATVGPGAQRRWTGGYSLRSVDLRPWVVLVPTQEVPTADGVTLKLTVAGRARITDATTYVTAARDTEQAVYLAMQIALRELVATTTVEELLTGRDEIAGRLLAGVRGLDTLGIAVDKLDLKDIILPAELKKAHAEVLVARAQGAAALERARGETAALRNLANAARMAADNPALVQLRLLQQLEASSGHTVIIAGPQLGAVVATAATDGPPSDPKPS